MLKTIVSATGALPSMISPLDSLRPPEVRYDSLRSDLIALSRILSRLPRVMASSSMNSTGTLEEAIVLFTAKLSSICVLPDYLFAPKLNALDLPRWLDENREPLSAAQGFLADKDRKALSELISKCVAELPKGSEQTALFR